jgi:hypothetical protein
MTILFCITAPLVGLTDATKITVKTFRQKQEARPLFFIPLHQWGRLCPALRPGKRFFRRHKVACISPSAKKSESSRFLGMFEKL